MNSYVRRLISDGLVGQIHDLIYRDLLPDLHSTEWIRVWSFHGYQLTLSIYSCHNDWSIQVLAVHYTNIRKLREAVLLISFFKSKTSSYCVHTYLSIHGFDERCLTEYQWTMGSYGSGWWMCSPLSSMPLYKQ